MHLSCLRKFNDTHGLSRSGCVLASRISDRRPDLAILLIEAGVQKDEQTLPAMGFLPGAGDSDIEWNYRSEPQLDGFGGNTVCLTSGKILGGGSAVNFQSFTRGPAIDLLAPHHRNRTMPETY